MIKITREQTLELITLLRLMELTKQKIGEIVASIETQEHLLMFLDRLSERNYETTPEETYQIAVDTLAEYLTMYGQGL